MTAKFAATGTVADLAGFLRLSFELGQSSLDGDGRRTGGLHNRLESGPLASFNVSAASHPDSEAWTARTPPAYSNADGKPWHLTALSGTGRIRTANSERAAAIC